MAYYYQDPARPPAAPPPPPPGHYYPYPPQNGYSQQPPQSPTATSPIRPHTAAPFPGPSAYGPPPSAPQAPAGYYPPPHSSGAAPPPPAAHAPPPASGAPPLGAYSAPAPAPPNLPNLNELPADTIRQLIEQLRHLDTNKAVEMPPTPSGSNPAISPAYTHAIPAKGALPPGQPAHYGYYHRYPPSHADNSPPQKPVDREREKERDPGYPSIPPKVSMPGSFGFPEAPVPPPSKTPAPQMEQRREGRPDGAPRKVSEQTSEFSFASASTASASLQSLMEKWGGILVEAVPGREPKPKPKLRSLYRAISQYLITHIDPRDSVVVTCDKLMGFYENFGLPTEEHTMNWKGFFNSRNHLQLSSLLCALNVDHHLVPPAPGEPPSIPGLTPRGFETWMFTLLMVDPDREARRLQKLLDRWQVYDVRVQQLFPRTLPRECFPPQRDQRIYDGWWKTVADYPLEPDSEDEKVPLPLPGPEDASTPAPPPASQDGKQRRRGYSMKGDMPDSAREDDTRTEVPTSRLMRKRMNRPYSMANVPSPDDFLTPEEKGSPTGERYRQPYAGAPNPGWREDINPRPVLGEERVGRTSSVRSSTKPPGGGGPGQKSKRRGRSVRPQRRDRDDSPERRRDSDDEDDFDRYEGFNGRRYDADGLYDDEPPPRHHRSRAKSRPPQPPQDIRDHVYQDDYERSGEYGRRPGHRNPERRGSHWK